MNTLHLFYSLLLSATFISCAKQTPPTITLKGDENTYLLIGDAYVESGATATDYRGKDISDEIDILGSVDNNAGFYQIDYLVSDKKGNTSIVSRNVTRGFRNTDVAGTYDVNHSANNGGGTYNFTGTITANTGDDISFTIDNSNCIVAPVVLTATMNEGALQFNIPDQSSNGHTITLGNYNNINGGTAAEASLNIQFQAFNGSITYNHTATWTKQ